MNPDRDLHIAELNGMAVGHIRFDTDKHGCQLTWSVAPEKRGKGIGKVLLKTALDGLDKPAYAEIKSGNIPSQRMAEYAGMVLEREENGVLYYKKS